MAGFGGFTCNECISIYQAATCSTLSNLSYVSGSCLAERLEPGVLHPYQHVLQRGGRQAPSHHAVNPGLHSITLEPKVSSSICRPPMLPNKSRLRRRRSQDQAHGTAAQAERRRRGACFPSMINAVRSSADIAQDFKDQRASSS